MIEQFLKFMILVIIIYLIVSGILWIFDSNSTNNTNIIGGVVSSGVLYGLKADDTKEGGAITNDTPIKLMELDTKPVNNKLGKKISKKISKKSHKHYDEYDDEKLLNDIIPEYDKTFDNIVIDGNNMIFQYAISKNKSPYMDASEYINNIKGITELLNKHFSNKNLYYVFKDSETKKQANDLMAITKTNTVRLAHKKIFDDLYKKYPNTRFVVAYGDEKYRDDYAAIWLADTLPDDTILLSRDRYRDVSEMKSQKLKFTTYGKRASKINKIINKPFNFVTKGSVKSALIGYSFNLSKMSGFYQKNKNKKSAASETVYIIGKI